MDFFPTRGEGGLSQGHLFVKIYLSIICFELAHKGGEGQALQMGGDISFSKGAVHQPYKFRLYDQFCHKRRCGNFCFVHKG